MDLDLRKLRYFVAVAEHLNFRRAAESLHIAQPVLSRQIRALEAELKVQLLVRDHRETRLTAAGEQLCADAGVLLSEAAGVQRRLARAARATTALTVAFMPGLTVSEPVRRLREQHPGLTVDVLRSDWDSQTEVLHDGRADVSFVRRPFDPARLTVKPLFTEPRVAMLPTGHALAARRAVRLAELTEETLLQDPAAVPEWAALSPGGTAPAVRMRPRTVEEKLHYVAAGQGFVLLPRSAATHYRRPDVVALRVTDIGPNEVCLAWASSRRSRLIAEFVALAEGLRPRWTAPRG